MSDKSSRCKNPKKNKITDYTDYHEVNPTKTWAKKMLPAVRKLIRAYKNHEDIHCPLCEAACGIYKGGKVGFDECNWCVWMLFEKTTCRVFEFSSVRLPRPKITYWKQSIPTRLRRLRGWEKKMVKIIKGE